MRGIVSYGGYVPWWRLQRAAIGEAHGGAAALHGVHGVSLLTFEREPGHERERGLGCVGEQVHELKMEPDGNAQ